MDWTTAAFSMLIGFTAMVSGGFWGLGGGWLVVPCLLLLGEDMEVAVAASLLQMLISTSFTVLRQLPKIGWKKGDWGWTVAVPLTGAAFIGGFFGRPLGYFIQELFDSRKPHQALFLVLLVYIFINTLMSKEDKTGYRPGDSGSAKKKIWQTICAGFGVGVLASLLGIGGGTVNRPVMKSLLKVPEKTTAAIARLSVFLTAISGTISYYSGAENFLDPSKPGGKALMIGLMLAAGGIIGFAIGTKMHAIVLNAGGAKAAHQSFALMVLLVSVSVLCKLLNADATGRIIILSSAGLLLIYLFTTTILCMAKVAKKDTTDETES